MKKIIDVGALRSDALSIFLNADPENIAVLCDYAMMESFKGSGETNIRRSLQIVSRHGSQVILLKPTGVITAMQPTAPELPQSLIDQEHTDAFRTYCSALSSRDEAGISSDIAAKQNRANQHFQKLIKSAEVIRRGIDLIEKSFREEDLKILRSGSEITDEFAERLIQGVMLHARGFYEELGVEANKAHEPTTPSVTPAADAPVAPDTGAAEL
jgi:hypothetical protein